MRRDVQRIACISLAVGCAALAPSAARSQDPGGTPLAPAKPHPRLVGAAHDFAGRSVAPVGDVDGDGRDDVLLAGNSAAFVVFGPVGADTIDLTQLGDRGLRIEGAAVWDFLGLAVDGAGDVNGDGRDDILVGVGWDDRNGRQDSGSAYVVFGRPGRGVVDLDALGAAGFRIDGAGAGDQVGRFAAGAGDVNGDGIDDVVLGTEGMGNLRAGRSAYVVFGRDSTETVLLNAATLGERGFRIDGDRSERPGAAVAGTGDVNGDGRDDVIVGAPWADHNGRENSGSAYLVHGKASRTAVTLGGLGTGGVRLDGPAAGEELGSTVARGGDINGDGRPDLLLASRAGAYAVFARAFGGAFDLGGLGAGGLTMRGGFDFGAAIADAGDVNHDRYADILVGGPTSLAAGAAYLVPGRAWGGAVDGARLGDGGRMIVGEADDGHFGAGVAGAGDVTGDGHPDLLVGAPRTDTPSRVNAGTAHVIADLSGVTAVPSLGALGSRIRVRGGFFKPGERLTLEMGGSAVGVTAAGDDGSLTFDVVVPAEMASGPTEIVVAGAPGGSRAVAAFDVVAPAPISLAPDSGLALSLTAVSGGRFDPGELVELHFDGLPAGSARADAGGRLASAPLRVPLGAAPGAHAITAVGSRSGPSAPATFRVRAPIWGQQGFSESRTGFNPYESVLNVRTVAGLQARCTGALGSAAGGSAPAVVGGSAFIGTVGGSLTALRTSPCEASWVAGGRGEVTSPAVLGALVYAGWSEQGLRAFDRTSGREVWAVPGGGGMTAAPLVTPAGVYGAWRDGSVRALDPAAGAVRWTAALGDAVELAPAAGSGRIFVASAGGTLAALAASTGAPAWRVGLPSEAAAAPTVAGGRVLMAGRDGALRALRSTTGMLDWTAALPDGPPGGVAVNGSTVLVSAGAALVAIDLASGRERWRTALGASPSSAPIVANGVVYVVSGPTVRALDAGSGEPRWSGALSGAGRSAPAVLDARLYVGSDAGQLSVFALDPVG